MRRCRWRPGTTGSLRNTSILGKAGSVPIPGDGNQMWCALKPPASVRSTTVPLVVAIAVDEPFAVPAQYADGTLCTAVPVACGGQHAVAPEPP